MLKGKNIILRPLKISDMEKTLVWRNDIDLIRLTQGIRFPKTREMEEGWFKNALTDTSNRNLYFAIDEIKTEKFVGIIQLNNIDYISGTALWGFIIGDKDDRGKGYSTEAPKLMFDYAFNVLNIKKISSYNALFNKATLKMHKKIGNFIEEGCLKKQVFWNNEYHDVLILSLFKEDFNADKQ